MYVNEYGVCYVYAVGTFVRGREGEGRGRESME